MQIVVLEWHAGWVYEPLVVRVMREKQKKGGLGGRGCENWDKWEKKRSRRRCVAIAAIARVLCATNRKCAIIPVYAIHHASALAIEGADISTFSFWRVWTTLHMNHILSKNTETFYCACMPNLFDLVQTNSLFARLVRFVWTRVRAVRRNLAWTSRRVSSRPTRSFWTFLQ